jgi:membrane-associated phospholipid phosphatase
MNRQTLQQYRVLNTFVFWSLVILAMMTVVSYFWLDMRVLDFVSRQHWKFKEGHIVHSFKQLGKAEVVIWLILLWALVRNKPSAAVAGLLSLLFIVPLVLPLKKMVSRPRPRDVLELRAHPDAQVKPRQSSSFPSGDTATAFAAAVAIAVHTRRIWTPVFIAGAIGVGVLRIAMLAHFTSDVCAGAIAGILGACLALWLMRRWPVPQIDIRWRSIGLAVLWASLVIMPLSDLLNDDKSFEYFFNNFGIVVVLLVITGSIGRPRWLFSNTARS